MTDATDAANRVTQAQIDRLVAGDLPEHERRSLLVWLDEDVGRWRACAIAFLEAQVWEAAAAAAPTPIRSVSEGFRTQARSASEGQPRGTFSPIHQYRAGLPYALTLAASIAIAFALGVISDRLSINPDSRVLPQLARHELPIEKPSPSALAQPLVATVDVPTNLDPGISAQLQLRLTSLAASDASEPSISDYDRKQWERRGFELIEERRYLPAHLPDGRQITVPVKKVQLRAKSPPMS
jgi:hypothetical protein